MTISGEATKLRLCTLRMKYLIMAFGHFKVGDHAIAQRANVFNIARVRPSICFSFFPNGQHFFHAHAAFDGDN